MHDEVAVRLLNRGTDAAEQAQSFGEVELAAVAVAIDRLTLDVLHHQERQAVVGRSAVDQRRDVRMLEPGQHASLTVEAGEDLAGIEPGTEQLDRDLLVEGAVGAFGEVDVPHAARTDPSHQAPRTDLLADLGIRGGLASRRRPEELSGALVGVEQRVDLGAQRDVTCAGSFEVVVALAPTQFDRLFEETLDPGGIRHRPAPRRSARGRARRGRSASAVRRSAR